MATRSSELRKYILRVLAQRGWTQKDLATAAGMREIVISATLNGTHEAKQSTLDKIARALDVPLGDLLEAQGYDLGVDPIQYRVRQMLRRAPWLEPRLEQLLALPEDEQREILGHLEYRYQQWLQSQAGLSGNPSRRASTDSAQNQADMPGETNDS